jgi:hypothetical protein
MMANQKLELTWIGNVNRSKLEPRILSGDPAKSYHELNGECNEPFPCP